ncbi:DUF6691 family protein [Dyella nitratireducens]|uniref:Membrane protein n=1 Tax=Dyella nitratireducens TaxID=1849580 RepID=A0ABQ1G8V4_9GAMM|nr:DUF6691 family protein [Dyella nitratireducens]GGA38995.1 membrane protein [Dyella nitratireducens]GLQ40389.1 membrane protein [Dyella nitratireducens]
MKCLIAGLAGLIFGVGLVLSGMAQPAVVLGFLDVAGAWDPRLLFVMMAAVPVTMIGYRWVWRRSAPWLADGFRLPESRRIDVRLVAGAALFGIGWGLAGYCPGPALVSLASGLLPVWALVVAMLVGWRFADRI